MNHIFRKCEMEKKKKKHTIFVNGILEVQTHHDFYNVPIKGLDIIQYEYIDINWPYCICISLRFIHIGGVNRVYE